MKSYACHPEADPEKREDPQMLASVEMSGHWTYHAYSMSHDRKSSIFFMRRNAVLIRRGNTSVRYVTNFNLGQGGTYWSPDNNLVTFWVFEKGVKGVGVLDVRQISVQGEGGPPPYKVAYLAPKGHVPFGVEWSPKGDAFYVVEFFREVRDLYSRIVRVRPGRGEPQEIVRIGGRIDFFMPPVSRFENGEGPSSKPYEIVFGHPRGLYLADPKTGDVRRIAQLPANGLHNLEWHPKRDQLTMFFKRAMTNGEGKRFQGVYLIHIDKATKAAPFEEYCEELYPGTDIHTLWYSPRGTYITWASADAIWFRKPDDPPESAVEITASWDGDELEIRGVSWHDGERKLAFTAGNHVFIYDLGKKESAHFGTFGREGTSFTAEPVWIKNRVVVTVFDDLTSKRTGSAKVNLIPPEENEEGEGAGAGSGSDTSSSRSSTETPK